MLIQVKGAELDYRLFPRSSAVDFFSPGGKPRPRRVFALLENPGPNACSGALNTCESVLCDKRSSTLGVISLSEESLKGKGLEAKTSRRSILKAGVLTGLGMAAAGVTAGLAIPRLTKVASAKEVDDVIPQGRGLTTLTVRVENAQVTPTLGDSLLNPGVGSLVSFMIVADIVAVDGNPVIGTGNYYCYGAITKPALFGLPPLDPGVPVPDTGHSVNIQYWRFPDGSSIHGSADDGINPVTLPGGGVSFGPMPIIGGTKKYLAARGEYDRIEFPVGPEFGQFGGPKPAGTGILEFTFRYLRG